MKKIQIALLGFLLPILCFSQVNEIKFNTQSIDFSLPPRTNISPMSIKLMDNYNFVGAPTAYGSILEIYGKAGHQTSQLYFGGWDNSKIRYREAFYNQNTWSSWITLLDSKNIVESDGVLKIKGTGNSSILGNLGIGTATPNAKLEVNGDTKINGVLNVLGSNALNFSTYGGGFYMSDTSWIRTSGNKNFYHNTGVMRTDGVFHVGPNGDRLVVDANGKVGIGTATPASKLDVMGNYSEVSLNANSLATANFRTAGVVQIAISTSGIAPYTTSLQTKHTSFNGITYPIALNPLGGNVGIGTTDPKAKLHVFGQENGAFNGLVIDNRKNYGTGSGIGQTSRIALSLSENGVPNPLDRIFGIIESGTLSESSSADGRLSFYVRQGGSVNEKIRINSNGNVGIGTTDPKNKLSVNGTIWAKEVKVSLTDAADWVFDTNYKLKPLADVEKYINENKHLPEVPSADEFRQNDMNVSEMSNKLLQKIEELTLYAIEQQKELDRLKTENESYKSLAERLSALEKELKKIRR